MSNVHTQDPAELIARIIPEDGADWVELNDKGQVTACGPIRADWADICERTAAWYVDWIEKEPERMVSWHRKLTSQERQIMMERGLKKAIEFRTFLLNATEPDGDKCVLKPLKKKLTISQEQNGDKNDG